MSYYRTKRTLPNGSWQTLRGGSRSRGRAIRHAHKIARHTHWEGIIIIFDETGRETYRLYTHVSKPRGPRRGSSILIPLAIIVVLMIAALAAIFVIPSLNIGNSAQPNSILQPTSSTIGPTVKPTMNPVQTTAANSWFSFDTYTTEKKRRKSSSMSIS
jgi:hypothetical protein